MFTGHLTFLLAYGLPHFDQQKGPDAEKQRNDLKAVLARHGIDDVWSEDPRRPGIRSRESVGLVTDAEGLFADVMTWLTANKIGPRVPAWLTARLGKIDTEGDRATVELGSAESDDARRVSFVKVNGVWYLEALADEL